MKNFLFKKYWLKSLHQFSFKSHNGSKPILILSSMNFWHFMNETRQQHYFNPPKKYVKRTVFRQSRKSMNVSKCIKIHIQNLFQPNLCAHHKKRQNDMSHFVKLWERRKKLHQSNRLRELIAHFIAKHSFCSRFMCFHQIQ